MTLCYVLHQTHSEFWHTQHSVFSGICCHIQSYSALLRHIQAHWDIIKAYSDIFSTLCNPQPCHIVSPNIFRTGGLFKTLWNVDQVYSEPCHRAWLRTLRNACIWRNVAYSESRNIQNLSINCIPMHIQNPVILAKMFEYSRLWHI